MATLGDFFGRASHCNGDCDSTGDLGRSPTTVGRGVIAIDQCFADHSVAGTIGIADSASRYWHGAAVIALVIYALLPIFQNTYLGISEIDASIEEAADAFGMSRMRKLFKVELPIALPQIIAGIRTALVLIIGTATLAALIGAGGLGTFIMLGIDRNDTSLLLIGPFRQRYWRFC